MVNPNSPLFPKIDEDKLNESFEFVICAFLLQAFVCILYIPPKKPKDSVVNITQKHAYICS